EVLALTLLLAGKFPHFVVFWIAASAIAGAVGALLTRRQSLEEDDYFFLPLGALLLAFSVLLLLAPAEPRQRALGKGREAVREFVRSTESELRRSHESGHLIYGWRPLDLLEQLRPMLPMAYVSIVA